MMGDEPEFGGDDSSDGFVEICVVEYDEGSVSTELHRHLLEGTRRLLHQNFSDSSLRTKMSAETVERRESRRTDPVNEILWIWEGLVSMGKP